MADSVLKLAFRVDPDFKEAVVGVIRLVRDAYDRGAISWQRRCELLDEPEALIRICTYDAPSDKDGLFICGVYAEPQPAFLAEIGLA